MANRFDVFTISKPVKDSNGFLRVDSTPTRSGVFTYYEPDQNGRLQQVRELRHPDDVFSKETLDSLMGVPYTTQDNHVSLFTPSDSKNKTFGMTMEDVARVDNHARVSIKIVDGEEIKAVENKESLELSAGYRCDVKNESGIYENEKYDRRQVNIRYNHVARVSNARGGETCRIRLDSKGAICGVDAGRIDSDEVSKTNHGESIMKMIQSELPKVTVGDFRLDADEVEFPEEYKGVVSQLKNREKSLIAALEEAKEKFDSSSEDAKKIEAEAGILKKENEDLKKLNDNSISAEKLDAAVEERAKHISYAKDYKVDEKLTNQEIRKEIVKQSDKLPADRLDDQTWVDVAFGMLDHEHEKKRLDSKDNLDNHKVVIKEDGEVSAFDKAKKTWRA